jgi:hypothetical protein
MHIEYYENTEEVRSNLKAQIRHQTLIKEKYTTKVERCKTELVEAHRTLSHTTAVLKMMEEDLAELEATKED